MSECRVVVVGAGPAGVSAAVALKDAGLRPVVLEQADQVGASWRRRHDRLRLNSSRLRRGLEPLVGHLGVLDERGVPHALGEEPAAPGLRFIGYVTRPGALGYMGKEGKRAAREIQRELRATSPAAAAAA